MVCALGLLVGCGFEIMPASYVSTTEIAAVRQVVVDLGPLNPSRVGPTFAYADEIPIAEVLPGDRLLLEAVVIDVDGVRLADDEIETLWLQCGTGPCSRAAGGFASELFDVPCSELGIYTTDQYCRLGTGTSRFEFLIPQIGREIVDDPRMSFYGVVAWGGKRVEDCWVQRRTTKQEFDGCGFVYHNVTVGPHWWLAFYADSIGIPPSYDPTLLSAAVLQQPANRIPRAPELTITVDEELVAEGRPPLSSISVQPGAEIEVALTFDVTSQLLQGSFIPLDPELTTFLFHAERVASRTLTTGAIRVLGEEVTVIDDGSFRYAVDPQADPGISRVLIGWRDERGANDILTVEFEVQ